MFLRTTSLRSFIFVRIIYIRFSPHKHQIIIKSIAIFLYQIDFAFFSIKSVVIFHLDPYVASTFGHWDETVELKTIETFFIFLITVSFNIEWIPAVAFFKVPSYLSISDDQ